MKKIFMEIFVKWKDINCEKIMKKWISKMPRLVKSIIKII